MEQKTRGDEGRPVTALANYTLTLTADGGHGTVTGGGSYAAGSAVTLTATPASGYAFAKWSDGSYMASRTLTMPAQNTSLTAYFNARVPFGSGCSSITVPPIEPICSYPTLEGTTPLALEVPVPRFVLPVPPAECACFTFVPGDTGTATVTPTCANTATTRFTLDIVQADPLDCCSGRYNIVPTLDLALPCMPFDVDAASVVVKSRSGSTSASARDGDATFTIAKGTGDECCELKTALEITFPDCVKPHTRFSSGSTQVTYYDHGTKHTVTDFITLYDDAVNCTTYPVVSRIDIPACGIADGSLGSGTVLTDGYGSYFSWSLDLHDCVPSLSFTPHVGCPCFSFTTGTANVTTSCAQTGSCSVAISRVGDCCDGTFAITPSVEIPCIPFSIGSPTINVANRSGIASRGVDGSASFSIGRGLGANCCTLNTGLTVRLPDCVKYHGPTNSVPDVQISYCENNGSSVATRTHKFVTMVEDSENCSYYPVITPITLPCCTQPDRDVSDTLSINGQTVTVKLKERNCVPELEITPASITIATPTPCLPEISTTKTNITASYKDSSGTTQTNKKIGEFQFTSSWSANCVTYTLGIGNLDLTAIGGGGGIGNGGAAFQPTGGKDVYLDGTPDQDDSYWYGGGYGDKLTDGPGDINCRGTIMRGWSGTNPYSAATYNSTYLPWVPQVAVSTKLIDDNRTAQVGWASTRKNTSSSGSGTTYSKGYDANYAHGNLSMVSPTGFQWHEKGLALTLTEFVYNESGLLSNAIEAGQAVLVSPSPSLTRAQSGTGVGSSAGTTTRDNIAVDQNASGLCLFPDDITKWTNGLAVKASGGLRIYNIGDGCTPVGDAVSKTARQGALEVQYGQGFRIVSSVTRIGSTTNYKPSAFRSYPSMAVEAIEPNFGRGLHIRRRDEGTSSDGRRDKLEIAASSDDFVFVTSSASSAAAATKEENATLYVSDKQGTVTNNNAGIVGLTNIHYDDTAETTVKQTNTWIRNSSLTKVNADITARGGSAITEASFKSSYADEVIVRVAIGLSTTKNSSGVVTAVTPTYAWLRFTRNGLLLRADYATETAYTPTQAQANAVRNSTTGILTA